MLNRSASLVMSTSILKAEPGKSPEIQYAFSKPSLVNLISKDTHLVFAMSMVFFIIHFKFDINVPWADPENFIKWVPDNFLSPDSLVEN